ncbi:phosphoenolpyruvate carboxylase [Celerinatantimonas sp. MCCC 1A17872]|uniref:phosphoenolpyruvate carboxylase n=1 Tax=Celerinatantimonas sp. MCCC 1A17872 TaxID=3177514 RepID=UPI0038C8F9A2
MTQIDKTKALRSNVSFLGQLLGKTIQNHLGEALLQKVETIRKLAKASRQGDSQAREELLDTLRNLTDEELLPVTRAFSQFLNLANIAEQFHTISRSSKQSNPETPIHSLLKRLKEENISEQEIRQAVESLNIELVLTAHPTEITRRTMIAKYVRINECLDFLELGNLSDRERRMLHHRLEQLIDQSWHTNEIRQTRPTPVEEARWGFAVIETSLWQAVPDFLRILNEELQENLGFELPIDTQVIKLTSWMGGDRDGNPFVTSKVTEEVLHSSRWVATDLYLKDLDLLVSELSMADCNEELRAAVGPDTEEPYRALLKHLRVEMRETREYLTAVLQHRETRASDIITQTSQVWEPLMLCYRSLKDCGMDLIADGNLLDMLRRLACFGVQLVRLDIRQESTRHTEVFSELTRYLGLGDYAQWSEEDKQSFLLSELTSKRPLIPLDWQPSEPVQEVLNTCRVIAKQKRESLGIYNISMASEPSDVLAVQLLLKDNGCPFMLPVSPLFETLDDLNKAAATIRRLLSLDWYRGITKNLQYVMIGYSDSAKDAGIISSAWAQYRAMEELVEICEEQGVKLILFHGRGGTIGRGGAPAHAALLSQPPGSLKGGLRVTEQGEMIRFKLGLDKVAIDNLSMYVSAVLEANLLPPIAPQPQWREVMDQMAETSCEVYRNTVRKDPDFVPYFRAVTPEQELGKLPLGSRPSKRNPNGGVESLRAIPWIFAWSQNRLLLPTWLGAGEALSEQLQNGHEQLIREMCEWPFFVNRLAMLDMVFMKTEPWLFEIYNKELVPEKLRYIGTKLCEELALTRDIIAKVMPQSSSWTNDEWVAESIGLRNPYIDPLNVMQVELLRRSRHNKEIEPNVDQALMVSIAGVAAGMRNTG